VKKRLLQLDKEVLTSQSPLSPDGGTWWLSIVTIISMLLTPDDPPKDDTGGGDPSTLVSVCPAGGYSCDVTPCNCA